jgi:16S rRNA (cytosine1402-N4)-methyltransferase
VPGAFGNLAALVRAALGERACNGVLIDCGVSSPQLDSPERGFSFQTDGPLDMRMDTTRGEPLSVWLARAGGDEIRDVIARLGEERFARRISEAIVRERAATPIARTLQLAAIVASAVPVREPGKHPATRTFQALRMWVNDELGQLRSALHDALELLAPGGRLAVISFHSLEDGVVRDFMQRHSSVAPELAHLPAVPASALPRLKLVGRKQRASAAEVARNPRARSALLRVAEMVRAARAEPAR